MKDDNNALQCAWSAKYIVALVFIDIPALFLQFLRILFAPPTPADYLSLAGLAPLRALGVAASFPYRSFVFIDIPALFLQFLRILFRTFCLDTPFVSCGIGPLAHLSVCLLNCREWVSAAGWDCSMAFPGSRNVLRSSNQLS